MEISQKSNRENKVLFISHSQQRCGVYQFGLNIANVLKNSKKYNIIYQECSNPDEFLAVEHKYTPAAIIYNHYTSTMPWLNRKITRKINAAHIGIIHEITQEVADSARSSLFQYYITPDPTLLLNNPIVFKTGRLIPKYMNEYVLPVTPTIGSFGFGTQGKGFEKLISTVQQEFDEAIIKLHIPYAAFGDPTGSSAQAIVRRCKDSIYKPGIRLEVSHNFLEKEQLLNFLAQNSLNAFLYEDNKGRGISSVIDYALAVQRPIAITNSSMFRHITSARPSICIEDSSLRQIMNNGFTPLLPFYRDWSEENLIWDYERILNNIIEKYFRESNFGTFVSLSSSLRFIRNILPHGFKGDTRGTSWVPKIRKGPGETPQERKQDYSYSPLSDVTSFNRILDDAARFQYEPVIKKLFEIVPDMMSRKLPEANIQQAFVLDTVYRFALAHKNPKMLCIGSHDDTAAASLKKLGLLLDEVDPLINYDLDTFMHKPSTDKESYDIVFATSVIEHVKNDELFLTQMTELLAPGGFAILTCDYNDQYKPGDRLPQEDFRFYTQYDIKQRLLPLLHNCSFVDTPYWDNPKPDFTYAGCVYTFATIVIKKSS
ncbi:MAG TPA: class I SAM-dependent methyltransferase [Nitrospirota bacterium]|nr:class I SAM-dependent methyltransferase [Nitrospirota bacterium]